MTKPWDAKWHADMDVMRVQGNHFSCSSAQDKGYLNLTQCVRAAGSAQA